MLKCRVTFKSKAFIYRPVIRVVCIKSTSDEPSGFGKVHSTSLNLVLEKYFAAFAFFSDKLCFLGATL